MKDFKEMKKREVLKRGYEHIFSTGINDSAAMLCEANMGYGLSKIHYLQDSLGLEPNATFIGAPDATVTRNKRRWTNGFGYGGKISWGDGLEKVVVLDVMPNACGMLVGGLDELPSKKELLKRISVVMTLDEAIDGLEMKWDFNVGNHFIDIFRYKPIDKDEEGHSKYAFIIHGSVPEVKGDNDSKFGFGLYYDNSDLLQEMAETLDTRFGKLNYLTDDSAKRYMDFHKFAIQLSCKKRKRIAEHLFSDFVEIANPIHQGLLNMNEIALGCQNIKERMPKGMFPIVLRSDLPAFLVRAKPNIKEDVIEHLGFTKRAMKHDVIERLLKANILPHGGGYAFPSILSVNKVIEAGKDRRYFEVDITTGHEAEKIISNPRDLEYTYRGKRVVNRTVDLRMCEIAARLMPRLMLKI